MEKEENKVSEPKKKSSFKEIMHKINRRHIHEVTLENDITYEAPLSYRHLRIIAWVFFIIATIGTVLSIGTSVNPHLANYESLASVFKSGQTIMSSLFLIAIFAVVLTAKDGYRRLILMYGGLTVLVYVAFVLIHQHYFVGLVNAILGDQAAANTWVNQFLSAVAKDGYLAFNIFIDLFLCTLVTFFINYHPKKYFQGKKLIIFRLFALLPILYEVGMIIVKSCAHQGIFTMSPFVYPLLPTKAPIAFIVFIVMALFIKGEQRRYVKGDKTIKDYHEFQKTNVHRLRFSFSLAIVILIASIVDILVVLLSALFTAIVSTGSEEEIIMAVANNSSMLYAIGFGKTFPMIFIIPLVLFFDYRKTYKNTLPDMIIPAVGIALVALTFLEGGFEVAKYALIVSRESKAGGGGGEDPDSIGRAINHIRNLLI